MQNDALMAEAEEQTKYELLFQSNLELRIYHLEVKQLRKRNLKEVSLLLD